MFLFIIILLIFYFLFLKKIQTLKINISDINYIQITNIYTSKSFVCYDGIKLKVLMKKINGIKFTRKLLSPINQNGFIICFYNKNDELIDEISFLSNNFLYRNNKYYICDNIVDFHFLEKLFYDISVK